MGRFGSSRDLRLRVEMLCVIQLLCQFFVAYRGFKDYKILVVVLHLLRSGIRVIIKSVIGRKNSLRHFPLRPFYIEFSRRLHLPYLWWWTGITTREYPRLLMLPYSNWGSFTLSWSLLINPLDQSLHVLKHVIDLFFVYRWLRGELALMLFELVL